MKSMIYFCDTRLCGQCYAVTRLAHSLPFYIMSQNQLLSSPASGSWHMSEHYFNFALYMKQSGFEKTSKTVVAPVAFIVATQEFHRWHTDTNFDLPLLPIAA